MGTTDSPPRRTYVERTSVTVLHRTMPVREERVRAGHWSSSHRFNDAVRTAIPVRRREESVTSHLDQQAHGNGEEGQREEDHQDDREH
jgi:hypothetical protein